MDADTLNKRFPLKDDWQPEGVMTAIDTPLAHYYRVRTLRQVGDELRMLWSDLTSHPESPSLLLIEQRILGLAAEYQEAGGS